MTRREGEFSRPTSAEFMAAASAGHVVVMGNAVGVDLYGPCHYCQAEHTEAEPLAVYQLKSGSIILLCPACLVTQQDDDTIPF